MQELRESLKDDLGGFISPRSKRLLTQPYTPSASSVASTRCVYKQRGRMVVGFAAAT